MLSYKREQETDILTASYVSNHSLFPSLNKDQPQEVQIYPCVLSSILKSLAYTIHSYSVAILTLIEAAVDFHFGLKGEKCVGIENMKVRRIGFIWLGTKMECREIAWSSFSYDRTFRLQSSLPSLLTPRYLIIEIRQFHPSPGHWNVGPTEKNSLHSSSIMRSLEPCGISNSYGVVEVTISC